MENELEKDTMNKLQAIHVSGDKGELWNFEAGTILAYINEIKKELQELREDNYVYHQLMRMQDKREYRSKFLKEFQEEHGKNVFPDYDEIYKRYNQQQNKIKKLERQIKIKDEYLELIHGIGFDYDGWNEVGSLKSLIDDLVDYAVKGIKNDDKSVVFKDLDGCKKYNVLHEEVEDGRK